MVSRKVKRLTEPREFKTVLNMVRAFDAEYYHCGQLNDDKLIDWMGRHLEIGVVFYTEGGFIGGFPVEDPVRDWTALVETGWYAKDRTGIALLRAFIAHARKLRMNEVRMTTLNTTPVGVTKLLRQHGFEAIETSHRLCL